MIDDQRAADFARIGADWLWETDTDDRFTFFSVETSKTGLDLAGNLGRRRREVATQDDGNLALLAALEERIARRETFRDFVFRTGRDDGTRWISISGEPRLDSDGIFLGYHGVGRDVTVQVEAQRSLEAKGRALDAILQAMPDGVHMLDRKGGIIAVNDQLYEIMEIPDRKLDPESAFQSMLELAKRGDYGPGDPETLARNRWKELVKQLKTQGHFTYQRSLVTGRWIEARARALRDGSVLMLYRDITEGKKREEELQRRAALLATIFANMDGGIAVFDKDARLQAWNESYPGIVGMDPALVRQGISAREVVTSLAQAGEFGPQASQSVIERVLAPLESEQPAIGERKRPDGRIIERRRNPVPGGGSVSIFLDITERKKAENALVELNATLERRIAERTVELAESERFLRSLVGRMPGMVYRCKRDRDGWSVDFASEGSRDLVGIGPEQLVDGTLTFLRLVHPDDRLRVWKGWREKAESGRMFELEYRVRHSDGSWRWALDRAHGVRDATGEVNRLEGLVMDVTARKQAETELSQVKDQLVDALESLDHNIMLWDRDDRLVMFTPHLYKEYPEADRFYVPGQTAETIFCAVIEAGLTPVPPGHTKESFLAERLAQHRRADGVPLERLLPSGRMLHISERPSRSGGIVAVGRDVTDQLIFDQRLREAQRMEAIGQLTGGLAHDLNNYLSVIMGNLDLLADRPGNDPETPPLIEGAIAGAQRGAELTRSLLAFSRRQPLDPKVLDVGEQIGGVVRLLQRTIGEKIVLVLGAAPDLWPVEIDGAQLDSSIVNLANNARDAMPDGGRLTITMHNATRGPEQIPAGDGVLIEVTDTGTGMAPPTLLRAFEPFFSTKGPGHGTGLGLSMVHGFVHQSGGSIELSSTVGVGTTVSVFLPRAATPLVPAAGRNARAALPRGTESILLVEDNEDVRGVVGEQMKSLGYQVTEAASGDVAVTMLEARAAAFDLVLSDVVMPGRIDGMALATIARDRWPSLAVVLTTGYSEAFSDEPEGQEAAFNILRKPYRKAELAHKLREALEKRG